MKELCHFWELIAVNSLHETQHMTIIDIDGSSSHWILNETMTLKLKLKYSALVSSQTFYNQNSTINSLEPHSTDLFPEYYVNVYNNIY